MESQRVQGAAKQGGNGTIPFHKGHFSLGVFTNAGSGIKGFHTQASFKAPESGGRRLGKTTKEKTGRQHECGNLRTSPREKTLCMERVESREGFSVVPPSEGEARGDRQSSHISLFVRPRRNQPITEEAVLIRIATPGAEGFRGMGHPQKKV